MQLGIFKTYSMLVKSRCKPVSTVRSEYHAAVSAKVAGLPQVIAVHGEDIKMMVRSCMETLVGLFTRNLSSKFHSFPMSNSVWPFF